MPSFPSSGRIFRFGPFEADLGARELRKRGRKVRLQGKPFDVLAALLERSGDVVTREELQEQLWSDGTVFGFDDNLNTAVGKLRAALGDKAKNPRFIETLPRRGYRFNGSVSALPTPGRFESSDKERKLAESRSSLQRIAVLPLEDLSRDPEQEYFADGMTDAIIAELAKLATMTVISRTSIMQYKEMRKPLRQIGRELDVGAIVEGSVLRADGRVRITAQLIDATSDGHLWGESFDRDLSDVLTLQSELAKAIAGEIQVQLSAEDEACLSTSRKVDPVAHEAYLRGRYCLNKRTEKDLEKSVRYFEQAIERDPHYAAVYSGLCDAYTLLVAGGYGANAPEELIPKARDAASRALEIDDTLADAHASLGLLEFKFDWDWTGAEKEFRRAIELNPNSVTAHHWYALYLMSMVRLGEAELEIGRAYELDPLSPIILSAVGRVWHFAGRFDAAVEQFRAVIDLDPKFAQAHFDLGMTYLEMKRFERAIGEFEAALELSGTRSTVIAMIGISYAEWGKRANACDIIDELKRLSEKRYVSPYDMAEVHLALGQMDDAFENLEKAFRERDSFMIYLAVDPAMRRARSDPRFQGLATRMRFPGWVTPAFPSQTNVLKRSS